MEIYILLFTSLICTCHVDGSNGNVARPATDHNGPKSAKTGCCETQREIPLEARKGKESPQSCTKGSEKQNGGCNSKDSHDKYNHFKSDINKKQSSKENSDDESKRTDSNEFILIKGGSFVIGTDKPFIPQDAEAPARKVTLHNFYIHKYEVSNNDFSSFIKETQHLTEVCQVKFFVITKLHKYLT